MTQPSSIPKRTYRLGKRAITVQETRAAILDAVYKLLGQPGARAMSVDDVAKEAGVARATVYYQFRNKVGLFREMNSYLAERGNLEAVRRVREHTDARVAIHEYIPAALRFWDADSHVYRNLFGIAALDLEVREATDAGDAMRRDLITWLVRRLRDVRALREGIDEQYATELIWLATSFSTYDHLCRQSGMSVDAAAATLHAMVSHVLKD